MSDYSDNHSKLRSSLFGGKSVSAPPDEELSDSDLPDTSTPYQAHARPANRPVYTLHCCLGKDGYRSFQYVGLDSDTEFKTALTGHVITLRFAGIRVMQITIRGRNLSRLYYYLHQHRLAWIMRADRDLADEQEAIITAIEISPVETPESRLDIQ